MKFRLLMFAVSCLFLSSYAQAGYSFRTQCNNCSDPSSIARSYAAQQDLYTGDIVNVVDFGTPNVIIINSFEINRNFNPRNGAYVYLAVSTTTSSEIETAKASYRAEVVSLQQDLSSESANIDITTVDNPCATPGPNSPKADSIWDVVACNPAFNGLQQRINSGEFANLEQNLLLKFGTLTDMMGVGEGLVSTDYIEFTTTDGAKLLVKLSLTAIGEEGVSILAEIDLSKSTDSNGNSLDMSGLVNGIPVDGNNGGGVYFSDNGATGPGSYASTVQSFLDAARRLGILVPEGYDPGGMSCVLSSDGRALDCTHSN